MAAGARLDYVAPWWTDWLHNFPHLDFSFKPVDATFRPEQGNYRQSLAVVACVGAAGLAASLLLLLLFWLCLRCRRGDAGPDAKRPRRSRCAARSAVVAGLVVCCAVGVGFYGNSEINDGTYRLTYSVVNANRTLSSIGDLSAACTGNAERGLERHLERLDEIFAPRPDYLQALRFMRLMADNVVRELAAVPDSGQADVNLTGVATRAAFLDYYRWLSYLLLLILDLLICLAAGLAMAKRARRLLIMIVASVVLSVILSWASLGASLAAAVATSDFCVSPDKFIVNQTADFLSADVAHYYLFCGPNAANPFQQSLTTCQRSLTTMQIQVQGLLQFSVPVFPTAERDLLGIQRLLNTSEFHLHRLTALLDCRGLHKDYLDALTGVCYDGVEGLLYLALFSLLAACALSAMLGAIFRAWTQMGSRDKEYDDTDEEDPFNPGARRPSSNPRRSNVHSFCSYTGSAGSQAGVYPPAPQAAVGVPPAPEYMNQSMLFGGSPRYENVPLIGRASPPPLRLLFAGHARSAKRFSTRAITRPL
ncbi:protein tweety homolog 2-like isoform X2 [Hippocampus zosterae]|uniref:protein tweety homolog 2-like isoform X2 n=1 Tax=Hippocampus zosterae TaxID=109293 RepID=UPI00223E0E43|nr:protein tweety homolog 2-like isoform X2 [Hippocampus zosterae]